MKLVLRKHTCAVHHNNVAKSFALCLKVLSTLVDDGHGRFVSGIFKVDVVRTLRHHFGGAMLGEPIESIPYLHLKFLPSKVLFHLVDGHACVYCTSELTSWVSGWNLVQHTALGCCWFSMVNHVQISVELMYERWTRRMLSKPSKEFLDMRSKRHLFSNFAGEKSEIFGIQIKPPVFQFVHKHDCVDCCLERSTRIEFFSCRTCLRYFMNNVQEGGVVQEGFLGIDPMFNLVTGNHDIHSTAKFSFCIKVSWYLRVVFLVACRKDGRVFGSTDQAPSQFLCCDDRQDDATELSLGL